MNKANDKVRSTTDGDKKGSLDELRNLCVLYVFFLCFVVADKDEESESSDSEERKIQRRLSKQETPALLLTHMALAAGDTYFADKTKQQRSIGNALSAH